MAGRSFLNVKTPTIANASNLRLTHQRISIPNTHFGFVHDENGTKKVAKAEQAYIDKVVKSWNKHLGK